METSTQASIDDLIYGRDDGTKLPDTREMTRWIFR